MGKIFDPTKRRLLAGMAAMGLVPTMGGRARAEGNECSTGWFDVGYTQGSQGRARVMGDGLLDLYPQWEVSLSPKAHLGQGLLVSLEGRSHNPKLLILCESSSGSIYNWDIWGLTLPLMQNRDGSKAYEVVIHVHDNKGATFFKGTRSFEKPDGSGFLPAQNFTFNDSKSATGNMKISTWLGNSTKGDATLYADIVDGFDADSTMRYAFSRSAAIAAINQVIPRGKQLMTDYGNEKCDPISEDDDCFLTTAACGTVGLADDCWELRTLRQFRDGWLAQQPGGERDIETYYNTAPGIVDAVSARPDAQAIWLSVYWRHIVPSALMARLGLRNTARRLYTRMMRKMARLA